jgi:hypothetical protein
MGVLDTFTLYAFKNETLLASGTKDSPVIKLNDYKPEFGLASVQVHSVGASSVVKLQYVVSNDGVTYNVPVGASDIVTAHAPGDAHYEFTVPVAKFMKIRATETGTTNPVTDLDVLLALR